MSWAFEGTVRIGTTFDEILVDPAQVEKAYVLAVESSNGSYYELFNSNVVGLLEQPGRQICLFVFQEQSNFRTIQNCSGRSNIFCEVAVIVEVEGLPNEQYTIFEAVKHLFVVGIKEVVLEQCKELVFVEVQFVGICDDLLIALSTGLVGHLNGILREGVKVVAQWIIVEWALRGLSRGNIIEREQLPVEAFIEHRILLLNDFVVDTHARVQMVAYEC